MNIKITKEQAEELSKLELTRYSIGSYLYGTNTENSDKDILIIYNNKFMFVEDYYPVNHQFQYDDVETNTQYIFSSQRQFSYNLFSGDSTINADVVLFEEGFKNYSKEDKLNLLRTYNIIKAFIGFAKRDLRDLKQGKGKNKVFHIRRSLYCADKLLNNQLPSIGTINLLVDENYIKYDYDAMIKDEESLRKRCNQLFESGELTMYPKHPFSEGQKIGELDMLLMNSMNIKEFKY